MKETPRGNPACIASALFLLVIAVPAAVGAQIFGSDPEGLKKTG
jgi:hypothetical protein